MTNDLPILEFDSTTNAIIEPTSIVEPLDGVPEHCVITFFQEVISDLLAAGRLKEISVQRSEAGSSPVYQLQYENKDIALFSSPVGAAMAAVSLEELIALGCKKFIVCGSAGALDEDVSLGELVIPVSAVRDEGTSYHYLPPSREVSASHETIKAIEEVLRSRNLEYRLAKTWTTDGVYRETRARISRRKSEGCLVVEMEAAALFAVAEFRKVQLGYILYGGDDVSGENWNSRNWDKQRNVREQLIWLTVEACLRL